MVHEPLVGLVVLQVVVEVLEDLIDDARAQAREIVLEVVVQEAVVVMVLEAPFAPQFPGDFLAPAVALEALACVEAAIVVLEDARAPVVLGVPVAPALEALACVEPATVDPVGRDHSE